MKLSVHFAWTYMVGFFWNSEQRTFYFCPLALRDFQIELWRE